MHITTAINIHAWCTLTLLPVIWLILSTDVYANGYGYCRIKGQPYNIHDIYDSEHIINTQLTYYYTVN